MCLGERGGAHSARMFFLSFPSRGCCTLQVQTYSQHCHIAARREQLKDNLGVALTARFWGGPGRIQIHKGGKRLLSNWDSSSVILPSFQRLKQFQLRKLTEKQEVQNEEGQEVKRVNNEGSRERGPTTRAKNSTAVFFFLGGGGTRDVPTVSLGPDVTTDATGSSLDHTTGNGQRRTSSDGDVSHASIKS